MILYLLVWECEEYAMEAEWTHFVSDKEVISYEEQLAIAKKFMDDPDDPQDWDIENIWLNSVTEIDGYTIKLEKAGK